LAFSEVTCGTLRQFVSKGIVDVGYALGVVHQLGVSLQDIVEKFSEFSRGSYQEFLYDVLKVVS
jgi:hypothetical protein